MSVEGLVSDPNPADDEVIVTASRNPRHMVGRAVKDWASTPAVLLVREAVQEVDSSAGATEQRLLAARRAFYQSSAGQIVFATDHFILESFSEDDSERFSPIYNFGIPVVQTSRGSGRQARMFNYAGHLLASAVDGSALDAMIAAWDRHLRGSATLNGSARSALPYFAELRYRDQVRQGYLTSLSVSTAAMTPDAHSFALSMFVVNAATFDRERLLRLAAFATSTVRDTVSVIGATVGSGVRPALSGLKS